MWVNAIIRSCNSLTNWIDQVHCIVYNSCHLPLLKQFCLLYNGGGYVVFLVTTTAAITTTNEISHEICPTQKSHLIFRYLHIQILHMHLLSFARIRKHLGNISYWWHVKFGSEKGSHEVVLLIPSPSQTFIFWFCCLRCEFWSPLKLVIYCNIFSINSWRNKRICNDLHNHIRFL